MGRTADACEERRAAAGISAPLRVHTRTETQVVSSYQAPNVIAKLEGSDPKLRNDYLILSAHLDHLGVGRLTLTERVANAPGRPSWYPESFFSTIQRR
jgi:Peptidase family M28